MPELPEVEMARRYLQATSLHQTILSARVLDERILSGVTAARMDRALTGRQFDCAMRHGKRLFLKLQDDLWLTLHLGLTGMLIHLESGQDEPNHTRLLVIYESGSRLAFDDLRIFGEAGITKSPQLFIKERNIGPDALQQDLNGFLESMIGRKGLIKPALLNQRLVAGLGNLYADEALFQAGICPMARSLSVEQLTDLFSSFQEVLKTSIAVHAHLDELPRSYLLPHRHPGGRCPLDGALLSREKIGGRTSYYCPMHQKMKKS
ncbi:MAG: formamidopyrimidine/5-formyluracil/ 5-hydroxymethyluracil DNA glycosylase [Methanosaeta sp. PtaU1.Bin112]|nr:MAG: formamidopyrimidine/5-formyluracil/ 5-hydroxymethyluracil DNA glycosylase [Methanosaeta sp. PtaU1.Bin112]